jgi:hypothetical protein
MVAGRTAELDIVADRLNTGPRKVLLDDADCEAQRIVVNQSGDALTI